MKDSSSIIYKDPVGSPSVKKVIYILQIILIETWLGLKYNPNYWQA